MYSKKLLAAIACVLCTSAFADDRVPALAGMVKTDAGMYKIVVLVPGVSPLGTYCGADFSYGFIREGTKNPSGGNSRISLPGCWGGTSPASGRNYEFRYMDPRSVGVRSFSVSIDSLQRLNYDTFADELFP